jgi:hypothetical protein
MVNCICSACLDTNPLVVTIITLACSSGSEFVAADCSYVNIITMLATGMDTTAHALSRAAISMAKYPEWLEKIWEEQQSIIATEGTEINSQVQSACPKIHYSHAMICLRVLNDALYGPVKCRTLQSSQLV